MSFWESLQNFVIAGWEVIRSFLGLLEPNLGLYLFLAAWVAFFLFAVNWVELRRVLLSGGWIGVLLVAVTTVLVWGAVAPPAGTERFFGLQLSNYVSKTVYVTGLLCIMLLCGSVQLARPTSDEETT